MNESRNSRLALYALLLAGGLLVRLSCLAGQPFFGDVPLNLEAVASGRMWIQFPGYVPYHLVVKALAPVAGGSLGAVVVFSLLCGMLTMFYVMRTAEELGGLRAAGAAGAVAGASLLSVYFSGVGSSYATDGLAVAGALCHGLRAVARPGERRQVAWAAAWCGFGILMRPLSGIWTLPALLWLAWRHAGPPERRWVAGWLVLTFAVLAGVSVPFYGSWAELFHSAVGVRAAAVDPLERGKVLAAGARLGGYPVYLFHVWLGLGLAGLPAALRLARRDPAGLGRVGYPVLLVLPYCLVLLRHLPQAGYLCFLAPVVFLWPFIAGNPGEDRTRLTGLTAAVFVALSLAQIYVVRPGRPTTLGGVALNAYFLQYSRAGIRAGMFETMASLAQKSGIGGDQIPEARRQQVIQGGH